MAEQSNMLWFAESTAKCPNWLHALTFPIKHPSTAALISDLNDFKFKEPQMSDAPAESAAPVQDAVSQAIDTFRAVADENASLRSRLAVHQNRNLELEARVANQRATIESFQRQLDTSVGAHQLTAEAAHRGAKAAESAESSLKAQLERALHTQKILERDLEEYQQAYADLKASVFSDDDRTLPPRLLAFGHGDYLVYPAKVCASDDGTAPKWGIVIDPNTPLDRDDLDRVIDKNLVLTDGDVAITFEKPSDVTRLIDTLQDVVWRMYRDLVFKPE